MNIPLSISNIDEGYVILLTGLLIVFSGLLTLTLFFKFGLPLLLKFYNGLKPGKPKKKNKESIVNKDLGNAFTGEVAAAISMGIHLYLDEQHDNENAVLTIKQARKMYSPWSSKIYGAYNNRF
ncbi:OadG family protein [Mangrovimonas sp. TPBH4]|uniref:OadG family protein n=1 Tax=Mangrovimonas sp. TPBH4 TaxID=1645914 RepID=UPI0006B61BF1|nr:OadG family protein [Mangrovimonas sp. TPBH4]